MILHVILIQIPYLCLCEVCDLSEADDACAKGLLSGGQLLPLLGASLNGRHQRTQIVELARVHLLALVLACIQQGTQN